MIGLTLYDWPPSLILIGTILWMIDRPSAPNPYAWWPPLTILPCHYTLAAKLFAYFVASSSSYTLPPVDGLDAASPPVLMNISPPVPAASAFVSCSQLSSTHQSLLFRPPSSLVLLLLHCIKFLLRACLTLMPSFAGTPFPERQPRCGSRS